MLKRLNKSLRRDERGITGLETAIILIAFVVVASVFAYTVLSAGIFSSQKGQEAIHAGLEEARASMELKGSVFADGDTVTEEATAVVFTLTNALKGQKIDLSPTSGDHVTIISYTDANQHVEDIDWDVEFIGMDNGDDLLEMDEQAVITVDLSGLTTPPGAYSTFTISVKPATGAVLVVERTLPARIDTVMDLN
jgi:flagellin FlaB